MMVDIPLTCTIPNPPLQAITRLTISGLRWHGDIKPENILDVRGRFKLADPGEARVKYVSGPPGGEIPKIAVFGGTRSFGKRSSLLSQSSNVMNGL